MAVLIKEIKLSELNDLVAQGADLIDVREEDEVARGMIEHSRHVALSSIPEVCSAIGQEKPTIFYCRSGRRSLKAAEIVSNYAKFPLYSLSGGYLGYLENKQ